MHLNAGDKAPEFSTEDITGQPVALADYAGKKLLLCFYRYAGCPFCNVLMHSLIERYSKLHYQGLEVVAFIQSSKDKILDYPLKRQDPKPPFPLVADPERIIYTKYGVQLSALGMVRGIPKSPPMIIKILKHHYPQRRIDGEFTLMPAFFLVNKDQTVYQAYYGSDFRDSIPEDDILKFLQTA